MAEAIDLLARVAEPDPPGRKKVKNESGDEIDEYLRWLPQQFFEALTLDDAAASCDMSRRKFTQLFKDRTRTTWLNYLQLLRIEHAVTLLKESHATVTSICFSNGLRRTLNVLPSLQTHYRKAITRGEGRSTDGSK